MLSNKQIVQALMGGSKFEIDRTSEEFKEQVGNAIAEDIELHEPPSLPHGGVHRGRDNFMKARDLMLSLWDQKLDVQDVWEIPEDDVVVLTYEMAWTSKETGRTASQPGVELVKFRDGKIVRIQFFPGDTKTILDTLPPSS